MCTNLSVKSPTGKLVTARTMDETTEMPSVVQLVPAGTVLLSGTTQYSFVGVGITLPGANPNSKPLMYSDGMNTSGLSAAALWLPDTVYQTSGTNPIGDMEVCGWALGNCTNVGDVLTGLKNKTVVQETSNRGPIASLLHWVFTDALGGVLIVEYINGVLTSYPTAAIPVTNAVLTNSPPYDWQTTNVKNCYDNLTVTNVGTKVEGQEINGSGMLGLPGDATPPSRFARCAKFIQTGYAASTAQYAVGLALQILQTAIVPYGTIMTSLGSLGDHTQWGVVRDHENRVFYFFSAFNNNLYSVDLTKTTFDTFKGIPLDQPNWSTPAVFS